MSSKWHGIDLDALECDLDAFEASLNELEASDVGSVDAPLTPGEYEEVMATAALEILTLTAELEGLRADNHRLRRAVRPAQDELAEARSENAHLRAALSAAEAERDAAIARATQAEAEAKTLRAQLDALANPVRERPTSTLTPGSAAADLRDLLLGEHARQAVPPTSSRRTSG